MLNVISLLLLSDATKLVEPFASSASLFLLPPPVLPLPPASTHPRIAVNSGSAAPLAIATAGCTEIVTPGKPAPAWQTPRTTSPLPSPTSPRHTPALPAERYVAVTIQALSFDVCLVSVARARDPCSSSCQLLPAVGEFVLFTEFPCKLDAAKEAPCSACEGSK